MRKCWCFSTDNRPSFAELLASLEEFQNKCLTMSPQEIAQLSPSVMDGELFILRVEYFKTNYWLKIFIFSLSILYFLPLVDLT